MHMNKKKKVVPKLRFPEYAGNKLEITKLGKISSIVKEKAGKNKYILMSVISGAGLIPQAEKFGREIAGDSYKNYIVIKKYDFAYNKSATKQFPEGYISMLEEYDIAAVPNSIFTCFRITDSESYPPFFDYLFNNNYHGHWLRKYIEVGARAHGALSVDTKHLWNMPLALPDFKEQQKIADCLYSIDELIDAESRKLDALKKYKKGLMQKLFPAGGKTLPEWRFPEFQGLGEWDSKSIGKACDMFSGGTPDTSKKEFYGGTIPFIRSAEINKNSTELFITEEGFKNSSAKMVKKGDILIALIYTYHFNILRNILEKTAAFHGFDDFSACIKREDDYLDDVIFARMTNLLSHGNHSIFSPVEMVEDNKEIFKNILNRFLENYKFNDKLFTEK